MQLFPVVENTIHKFKHQASLIVLNTQTEADLCKIEEPKSKYDDHNKTADTIKSDVFLKRSSFNKFKITEESLIPLATKDKENIQNQPENIKHIEDERQLALAKPLTQSNSRLMGNTECFAFNEKDNDETDNIKARRKLKSNKLVAQQRKREKCSLCNTDYKYLLELERIKQDKLCSMVSNFTSSCMNIVKSSISKRVYPFTGIMNI